MNKIYKVIHNVFIGKVVTFKRPKTRSKIKGYMISQNRSNALIQPYSDSYVGHHLRLVLSALLVGLPLFVQAEDIIFDNEPSKLRKDFWGMNYNNYYSLFPTSSLTNNTVKVISGTISSDVYGGVTNSGQDIFGNSVTILGGSMLNAYGGRSDSGNTTGNSATISGGEVNSNVYGGRSDSGNATGNRVTISDGVVGSHIYGGYSRYGSTIGNTVTISGGKVGGSGNREGGVIGVVYGGYSAFNNSAGNSVIISGGEVGMVYGGYSASGNVTGNSVTISNGEVTRNVYGGNSNSGDATGNTVTISGNAQFSSTNTSLYGGFGRGDTFTDNTLNFSAHPITVNKVANFEHYNFTLDPTLANTTRALITTDIIELGNNAKAPSIFKVVGIHPGSVLKANDKFFLIQANDMKGNGMGTTSRGIAQQGISFLYDIRTDVGLDNNEVTATIIGDGVINPQLKALPTSYLAGAQLITRGADMIAEGVFGAIREQEQKQGLHLFSVVSGNRIRYKTDSHIKSNDFLFTGGLNYQYNNLTVGSFLEGGVGNYDTYNSIYNAATVHGDGKNHYYGAGLLGRYDFNNGFYTDATIRFGQNHNKFDTKDMQNLATGQFAKYNLKANYASAHMGVGYMLSLSDKNQLDLSTKYLWTQLGSKNANVAGDKIHFDRINSHRTRVNAKLSHKYNETVTFNAGLGYEHEFDGKAKATTYGTHSIDAPKARGGTGIFSVGVNIKPATNQRFSLDIKTNGYTGKREGIGANIRGSYAF